MLFNANTTCQMNMPTIERMYSTDTYVLVFSIRRFTNMVADTCMSTWPSQKRRYICIRVMYDAIGSSNAATLLGFRGLTGADIIGKLGGKGKITCWLE